MSRPDNMAAPPSMNNADCDNRFVNRQFSSSHLGHSESTYLLVVQARRQREDPRLGIQREHIVGPVRDDCIGDGGIRAEVRITGGDDAHLEAPGRILRDVERVRWFRK